jgi:hypothetical protein
VAEHTREVGGGDGVSGAGLWGEGGSAMGNEAAGTPPCPCVGPGRRRPGKEVVAACARVDSVPFLITLLNKNNKIAQQ